jgi:hypothetical protein
MATKTLIQVADRMASDFRFRKAVIADPKRVLAGFDLTDDEQCSLIGDSSPDVGVDQRTTTWEV